YSLVVFLQSLILSCSISAVSNTLLYISAVSDHLLYISAVSDHLL
ncbi:unnamed protein product, partial [Staurois parvus]